VSSKYSIESNEYLVVTMVIR